MDRKNMTVGLVMAYTGTSYGMNLQALALQHVIESFGYNTEIIKSKDVFKEAFVLNWNLPFFIFNVLKNRIKSKFNPPFTYPDEIHKKNQNLRVEAAQAFRNVHLHNFTPFLSYSQLVEHSKKYDSVVVGSDQCWLPGFSFGGRFSLCFAPKGVKRISYATSLGVSSYPKYFYMNSRKAWKRFDSLSVREEEGKKVVQDVCGENFPVTIVADPTYLITKEEWEELIPFKRMEEDKYVLSFILGNSEEQQMCAKKFAEARGLKLLSILSNESVSSIDTTYADRTIVGASPEEFINYIRGAEYVFTDSFHGIAFSAINNKQMFVFYRKNVHASGKNSRNSRIDNILRMWQISDRLLTESNLNWNDILFPDINYNKVNRLIIEKREMSTLYLKNALKN